MLYVPVNYFSVMWIGQVPGAMKIKCLGQIMVLGCNWSALTYFNERLNLISLMKLVFCISTESS